MKVTPSLHRLLLKGGILFSKAVWTLKDILFVTVIIFLGPIVISPLVHSLLYTVVRSQRANVDIFIFVGSIFMIFVPLLWIKTKYRIGKTSLGIRKGRWRLILTILIGVGTGVIYFVLESIISGRNLLAIGFVWGHVLDFFSSWFIFRVLGTSVLSPIGQEVYFRGFVYGYLRGILGKKLGSIAQALVFSFFHLDFIFAASIGLFFQRFFAGILLGLIYEVSDSIYPSIACHVIVNFLYILWLNGV
jgi:membrane protease YdiL (CAAX protease family)